MSASGGRDHAPLIIRQLPGRRGRWDDYEFYVNSDIDECDWWVVCHITAIEEIQKTICDPSHVIFLSMEPIDWGCSEFYRQFSSIVTCDASIEHPRKIRKNIHTWWAGMEVEFQNGHVFN
ncbi:MAG: hypothetical protein ACKO5F_07740, partial [Synechococcus sp.]